MTLSIQRCFVVLLVVMLAGNKRLHAQVEHHPLAGELQRRIAERSTLRFAKSAEMQVSANESDSLALIAFYRSLGGSVFWSDDTGWLDTAVSSWHGITLNADGRVTHIELSDNFLLGELPPELGELAHLRVLSVSNNVISGSIPESAGHLDSLRTFSVWANILSGTIPASLANLQQLQDLLLFSNRLTGAIPPELGQITRLRRLWLDFNRLTGQIPSELSQLRELTELFVDANQLDGEIPIALSTMPNLISLYVGSNRLTGPIPGELGNIRTLENFSAAGNQHNGTLPAEFSKPPLLTKLFVSRNQLTGTIPREIASLAVLTRLEAADNRLSGPLPEYLGAIDNLRVLDLSGNAFTGDIPATLGVANGLTDLDLSRNQLTGELPGSFGLLNRMQHLDLSGNRLSGTIDVIYNMIRLRTLNLRGNGFSGELFAGFAFMPVLKSVDLGENRLSGTLDEVFRLPTTIRQLKLDNNRLTGAVPRSILQSEQLQSIYIQGNQFAALPDVTVLSRLDTLNVTGNILTFADLIPNVPIAARGVYQYAPQDSLRTEVIRTAHEVLFTVAGDTDGNQYRWMRNGEALGGAQTDTLRVNLTSDPAWYHVVITNSALPELTLISRAAESHGMPTNRGSESPSPYSFALHPNYPNPFAVATRIPFEISMSGPVRLTLYNLLGQRVATLLDRSLGSGEHAVELDGHQLSPGVYVYRLEADGQSGTRTISVVK